jgi:N-acetylneuraminate lyase
MRIDGIIPALVTPLRADGSLNTEAAGRLTERLLADGASGLYVCGSTGECFLMSAQERIQLVAAVCEAAAGRGFVIAHVGAIATADAIELGRHAASAGVVAVSSVPPFYYKFTLEEIKGYYRDIMDAVSCPLVLYNFPALTGVAVSADAFGDLLADPRLAGVKHTSSDFFQLERIKRTFPRLAVLNGYDEMFLAGLAMGADGAIGSTFNFLTPQFVEIRRLHHAGAAAEALALQAGVNELIAVLVKVGVYPGIKHILRVRGLDVGDSRKPFAMPTREQQAALEQALARLG